MELLKQALAVSCLGVESVQILLINKPFQIIVNEKDVTLIKLDLNEKINRLNTRASRRF